MKRKEIEDRVDILEARVRSLFVSVVILALAVMLAAAAASAQEPCPDPMTLAQCLADADIQTLPPGQRTTMWSSTLPLTGPPVQYMEWRFAFRQQWPEIPSSTVAMIALAGDSLKSRVKFWADGAWLNGYEVQVRGIDGQGVAGNWTVPTIQEAE